jgi:ubiquinone/menaquinone biosynthesis C-methylase UbiE
VTTTQDVALLEQDHLWTHLAQIASSIRAILRPRVTGTTAEHTRAYYDRTARQYDSSIRLPERLLLGNARQWATSQARGAVLEVGVGTGRNLPYYSNVKTEVGIDLSRAMLEMARERAHALSIAVDLREATAETLPFRNASFDTVVCTLTLCSVTNERQALHEMWRVLRSGGHIVLVEHVRSPVWPVRMVQRLLEPLSVHFEQDHLLRDPVDWIADARFQIELCERSKWGIIVRIVARKSGAQ